MKKLFSKKSASLFMALLIITGLSLTAYAENIKVKKGNVADTPFSVENMFPGDSETNDYNVKVNHKNPVDLYFTVELHPGSEKLAEALMVKVYLPEKEIMLYHGPFNRVPEESVITLPAGEDSALYRITAYLDASTGNEYMYKELSADFRWWYREEETSGAKPDSGSGSHKPVDTGDNSNIMLWAGLSVMSLAAVIIIVVKNKKDEEEENG